MGGEACAQKCLVCVIFFAWLYPYVVHCDERDKDSGEEPLKTNWGCFWCGFRYFLDNSFPFHCNIISMKESNLG
jgi:hypothetical protein